MVTDEVKERPPVTVVSQELLDEADQRLTPAEKRDARRAAKALERLEAGGTVTITSTEVKRLTKALKKGGRKTREGLDIPDAATVDGEASKDHKQRVRGIALENGIPQSIADQVAEETDPEIIKPAATNKQLLAFIERVESIERDLAEHSEDRKQVYAEARSCGFDVPTMRKIVALRKMDENDRLEADALLATYMHGVGMAVQTDMGF